MSRSIISQDAMVTRTLTAFLKAQYQAYLEGMPVQEHSDVAETQAVYEVSCLALNVLTEFILHGLAPQAESPLVKASEAYHNAICETGDEWLRARGHKPEEF
jgi:hypothetical protein